jgi:small subunit ribosomal protein S21
MLIIQVKEGESIDKVLKRYKRKFDKTKVIKQLRARQAYIKPSIVNRKQVKKAVNVQAYRNRMEA